MANIDPYIEQIENARYGKDVRQAIVNALTAMNQEIVASGVVSFNERRGHVVSADGDYSINQISSEGGLDGQVPVVNSNGRFTMRTIHGEINTLGQLTDVNISNLSNGQILKYDANSDEWKNANDSDGHTIKDSSGTSMTQRSALQFNGCSVTDDSTNGKTIVTPTVDDALSDSSTNPLQNKVVKNQIDTLTNAVTTALARTKMVYFEGNYSTAVADTWEYTGISFSIPAGYIAVVVIHANDGDSIEGIGLSTDTNYHSTSGRFEIQDLTSGINNMIRDYVTWTNGDAHTTNYLWVKRNTTTTNTRYFGWALCFVKE